MTTVNYEQPDNALYSTAQPQRMVFDGKRMRKQMVRRTVDFNSTVVAHVESRIFQRDPQKDIPFLQPHQAYCKLLLPASAYDNPITSLCTKFVHTSTNKVRCPINVVVWTPEGRRLITGASSGEFTLWNGLTFNFETILQAHGTAVRAMIWSHNENWMVTGDHGGTVKYWQSNMNNVKAFQAHNEAVRALSFCPTDLKFASCSDDITIKIWDFARCQEEKTLTGHGGDVKCISWHPSRALIASGSKDNSIKIWDPKAGKNITTLHGHKNTILQVKCNNNGNWLLSGSRDQLVKVFDLRMMKEMHTFRGHKREVTSLSWHPFHEDFFVSGSFDGSILFWNVGSTEPQGEIIGAHESSVWDLAWHPLGHILCSGSNDHTTKFWCRNRPGDNMKDKYNMPATLPTDGTIMDLTGTSGNQTQAPSSATSTLPIMIPGIGGIKMESIPGLLATTTAPPPALQPTAPSSSSSSSSSSSASSSSSSASASTTTFFNPSPTATSMMSSSNFPMGYQTSPPSSTSYFPPAAQTQSLTPSLPPGASAAFHPQAPYSVSPPSSAPFMMQSGNPGPYQGAPQGRSSGPSSVPSGYPPGAPSSYPPTAPSSYQTSGVPSGPSVPSAPHWKAPTSGFSPYNFAPGTSGPFPPNAPYTRFNPPQH